MSIRELSPELLEKAKKEINEDPERIKEDIQHIKDWIKKQPHLRARTDDQWILTFLRGCKFSLERTKEKIDFFYTIRTMLKEFFADRDPLLPEIQEVLKLGVFLPIKKRENETDPTIILIRGGCYDPEKIRQQDVFKANMMAMDIGLLEDDHSIINGMHVVQDMKGSSLGHLMSPALAKKAMTVFQQMYPNRPKGIHFFNLTPFFETMYSMVRPFLTEKMKNRMNIHTGGTEDLFKKLPQKLFPKDYGGEGPSVDEIIEEYKKKVEEYRDWFLEDAQYGVDESKRPGKPKSADELFGIEGSFRKLNVD